MPKTRAYGGVGGGAFYNRIIGVNYLHQFVFIYASVANQAILSPIEVNHGCTVHALGLRTGNCVNGNMQMGLYDGAFNRLCVTAITPVAGLAANAWNWLATTTTPILQPEVHWIALACDANYVAAVSGMQIRRCSQLTDMLDAADLGHQMRCNMAAAYPLPDPLVPVNAFNTGFYAFNMRVTP